PLPARFRPVAHELRDLSWLFSPWSPVTAGGFTAPFVAVGGPRVVGVLGFARTGAADVFRVDLGRQVRFRAASDDVEADVENDRDQCGTDDAGVGDHLRRLGQLLVEGGVGQRHDGHTDGRGDQHQVEVVVEVDLGQRLDAT